MTIACNAPDTGISARLWLEQLGLDATEGEDPRRMASLRSTGRGAAQRRLWRNERPRGSQLMAAERNDQLVPRRIRFHDARFYVGMDRTKFNATVRLLLTEMPPGEQGIAFDRLDLDAWRRSPHCIWRPHATAPTSVLSHDEWESDGRRPLRPTA